MSNKRAATSVLHQDNWNDDDDVDEDMGVFKKAAPRELERRPIKVARRRGIRDEDERDSVFKNFTAFGGSKTESATLNFSFLSGEKPKLTNVTPFPAFNLNSTSDSSKKGDNSTNTTAVNTNPIPTLTFTPSSNSMNDNKSNVSTDKNESESASKSTSTISKTKPSINFNTSKTLDSTKSTPETETSFKFGINSSKSPASQTTFNFEVKSKENESTETKTNSSFKFGTNPNSKENESSKTITAPLFQFGASNDASLFSKSLDSKSEKFKEKNSDTVKESPKISKINGLESNSDLPSNNKQFLTKLKTLNQGVLNWVKQHLDKNQYINLSPIFDDYKDYYQDIKVKYGSTNFKTSEETKGRGSETSSDFSQQNKSNEPETKTPTFTFGVSSKDSAKSVFGNQSTSSPLSNVSAKLKTNESNKTSEPKLFNFAMSNSNSSSTTTDSMKPNESESGKSKPTFSFGLDNKTSASNFSFGSSDNGKTALSGFSFGVSKDKKSEFNFDKSGASSTTAAKVPGFSFKLEASSFPTTPSNNDSEKKKTEEESDEVPKVEVTEVKEDDAIYEKKVKLFYKKSDKYVDRGVGTLFLKPAGDKTQLLIRALTNLGNILLNIILNESIPTQRMGKNNVMIVCVPNPPIDPNDPKTPVMILIRVKSETDAVELLAKIDEHKKDVKSETDAVELLAKIDEHKNDMN